MDPLPSSIQITAPSCEIYRRGNILSLFYAGTNEAMYKYPGAIFGISATRAREALKNGDAAPYPNALGIPRQI